MTKTTRNLALLAALSIIVAGCTTLLNTQADFWADQAEQIARNCPAASTQARAARAAADAAAAESTAPADAASARAAARDELVRNLARANTAWDNVTAITTAANSQRLADCLALPTSSPTIGGVNVNPRENMINQLEQEQAECGQRAACLERGHTSAECGVNACFGLGAETCRLRERIGGLEANFCRRGQPPDADSIRSYQDGVRQAKEDLTNAKNALADFDEETSRLSSAAAAAGRGTIIGASYPEQAQAAYQEAQRIAAEQCGEGAALQEAPPNPSLPSGEYPQDILNSQPMGLPGGPAPLACCSTNPICAICTGGCPAFCSVCNTGC